ncbi:MAG: DUF5796 family protein [Halodesulfurarchaeum sp.]
MSGRNEVIPEALEVELEEEGIYVHYLDGRRVFYNGVPEPVEGTLRCRPGKDVQVLVTGPDGEEGILTYVNELKTDDDILETSGVGRILLDSGETATVYPGVRASVDGLAVEVSADWADVDGRVFVFEEDELGEEMYELVDREADELADNAGSS